MRLLSLSRAIALTAACALSFSAAFAAAVKLEVTAPATAKTGEAIDVTVRAVDSDGKTVPDYAGIIFFTVDGDDGASVPNADEGYTFIDKDQGAKTFSKGVTFKKPGTVKVDVLDLDNEKLKGSATVAVSSSSATPVTGQAVTIVSPEANTSVSDSKLPVVGKTKVNSTVRAYLSGAFAGDGQSDANGNFSFTLTGLTDGTNVIRVDVLDGTDAVIGTSGDVAVSLATGGAVLKGASVKEGANVMAGSTVTLVAASEVGLSEVLATFSGQTYPMSEDAANPGTYVTKIALPTQSGSWTVGVSLKNKLGVVTKSPAAATVSAVSPVLTLAPVTVDAQKATFNFTLDQDNSAIASFAVEYGTGSADALSLTGAAKTDAKSKSVSGSGFAWYVNNLPYGAYAVKVVALDASGAVIPGVAAASGVFEIVAPLEAAPVVSAEAAPSCTLGNVEGLKVTTDAKKTKSTLTWDTLTGSVSYDVFKKDASGQPVLVENVKATSYVVYISGNKVTYDEFAVKGVCANPDGSLNASPEFKQMVKVQTGPGIFLALLVLAGAAGFAATRLAYARK